MFYNTAFTAFFPFYLAVFDRDISDANCYKFPQIHRQGIQHRLLQHPALRALPAEGAVRVAGDHLRVGVAIGAVVFGTWHDGRCTATACW